MTLVAGINQLSVTKYHNFGRGGADINTDGREAVLSRVSGGSGDKHPGAEGLIRIRHSQFTPFHELMIQIYPIYYITKK
jgi:hypothetical protein